MVGGGLPESGGEGRAGTVVTVAAGFLLVVIPVVHFDLVGRLLWSEYDHVVDRATCGCTCWDTVFKGQYERGVASYKHIYFNITANTLKIWILTVVYLLAFYECAKKIFTLCYLRQIRFPMFVLFVSVVFPHYYSWWAYFNYLNDEFYNQWYHQIYFSVTEAIATFFVVKLLDAKVPLNPRYLLVILTVSTFHISASLYDQFLSNVLAGKGYNFQVLRDLGLMIPDLLHFVLPFRELRNYNVRISSTFSHKDWVLSVAFFVFSWIGVLSF